jgi:3-oxoadipate enol-lactonase
MNDIIKVNSDGLELVAESSGSGFPIISAHGLTGNRHISKRKFQTLAKRFRIVVFDQRGHNDSSPVTVPSLYNPDRMAEDMRNVMDAYQIDTAIIQGESMGAATSLLFALKYPQRVKTLILTGPAFGDKPNPEIESLRMMAQEIKTYGKEEYLKLSEQRMRENWNAPDEVIETVQFMQNSHQEDSLITALDTVKDWIILDDIAEISQLTMPVYIIAWRDDPLHPLALAERMVKYLPDTKLEILPSVAHVFLNNGTALGDIYNQFLANDSLT